jgi:alkaline phosphatase/alkaline phosphatase D
MCGEVSQTSVILQSRLTSSDKFIDRRWTGIPGSPGVARFELSTRADFSDSLSTVWLHAVPEWDYIVKTRVAGLKPGTRYYYRLLYGPDKRNLQRSEVCTFKTHPGEGPTDRVSFAVVTGMNYSFFHFTGWGKVDTSPSTMPYQGGDKHLGYPALETILELKPDYFVGTGDNVYYDHPVVGRAETQHQLRMKYQEQFSQPRFLDLFAEIATYWMKDDHDHRYNDSDPVNPFLIATDISDEDYPKANIHPRRSGSGFQPSHELGVRMFHEQLPTVDPDEGSPVTYRTYRVNQLLQIWFVEGRDHRSPNDMPDGPKKSIWGTEQRAWLKQTLLESDAHFKILFSATPMVGPDAHVKRDNHVNPRGFRHEGDEFFRWLQLNNFSKTNFFIVCGDRHWQYHAIHPSGFEEFSCGALVDANAALGWFPGDPDSSDPEGRVRQPYHYEEPTGGFLLVSFEPGTSPNEATMRFRFFDEKGTLLYETKRRSSL